MAEMTRKHRQLAFDIHRGGRGPGWDRERRWVQDGQPSEGLIGSVVRCAQALADADEVTEHLEYAAEGLARRINKDPHPTPGDWSWLLHENERQRKQVK